MAYQVTDLTTVGQAKALAQKVNVELNKKANLVTNLVAAGNLAMLTANGDIADSNIKMADVIVKLAGATAGTIPTIGSDGGLSATNVDIATDAEFAEMLDEVFSTAA